jgi:sugar lactone lactonase YvrE
MYIVLGRDDNFYISECDSFNRGQIRKMDTNGNVSTFVRNLGCAMGVTFDSSGNLYVAETNTHKILKITTSGNVTTFAGSGVAGNDNGQGTAASFNAPIGLVFDSNGDLYVSEAGGNKIRKITPSSNVTTFAGSGFPGNANGQGAAATFNGPVGMAFDNGILYVAENRNNQIRRIDANGNVTTFIGTGSAGMTDGAKTVARFDTPLSLISDRRGGLYVADFGNDQLRRVSPAAP